MTVSVRPDPLHIATVGDDGVVRSLCGSFVLAGERVYENQPARRVCGACAEVATLMPAQVGERWFQRARRSVRAAAAARRS